jgi:hypothetical protein
MITGRLKSVTTTTRKWLPAHLGLGAAIHQEKYISVCQKPK